MPHDDQDAQRRRQRSQQMLAGPVSGGPVASSSSAVYYAPPPPAVSSSRTARFSPAASSTASSSSRSSHFSQPLHDSLIIEEGAGSPATSEGNGAAQQAEASAMDVEPHQKMSRRISNNSSASSKSPATTSRRSSDPTRPARRKSQKVDGVDLVNFPAAELIHVLASLLQHIARANDGRRASGSSAPVATPSQDLHLESGMLDHDMTAAAKTAHNSTLTTLCFHARNVPSIAIEAYLLRILKYCPTTNEVFISLLVYFDRMARSVFAPPPSPSVSPALQPMPESFAGGFAIDSYNVHRLIIAGVTVASKFFSDVFYTNSRYAKVGGLPLNELNQLELHFLLLNDFQLTISLETLQEYADSLLRRFRPPPPDGLPAPTTPHRHSDSETSTVRGEGDEEGGMVAG